MNKLLESLERLAMPDDIHVEECKKLGIGLTDDYDVVEQALLELISIKEAKSNEALKCLEYLYCDPVDYNSNDRAKDYETIKQYILKEQALAKENELLKEIIKSLFDRGCPLHQYTDKEGVLTIEVDNECSIMRLGEYKGIDLDKYLKEVLE